jgi:hypothetical protein
VESVVYGFAKEIKIFCIFKNNIINLSKHGKQTNEAINMVQFTMTIDDEELKRKNALDGVTHRHIYLTGLAVLEHEKERKAKREQDRELRDKK